MRPYIQGYNSNTPSSQSGISSLYGISGGVSNFGTRQNPKSSGAITVTLGLLSKRKEPGLMQSFFEKVNRAFSTGGEKTLYYAPRGTPDPRQWHFTRAKAIVNDDNRGINELYYQSRQIQFELAEPFWYQYRYPGDFAFDDIEAFDRDFSTQDSHTLSVGGSFTVYNAGDADALPTLVFDNNEATSTLGGFEFARVDTLGFTIESFSYAGTIQAGNAQLIVNAYERTCTDLANLTITAGQVDFLSLPPGENTLKLLSASTLTASPLVLINFEHTYHA